MRRGLRRQVAAALVEFALAWPIALLIVFATVEAAVWAAETYGARAASLAGARAGSISGGTSEVAATVTRQSLSPALVGVQPSVWCPGLTPRAPEVWVCAIDLGDAIEVDVGGSAPALVPFLPGTGLPLHAHVVMQKEVFSA
jgi:Flp pilus assembly protein TadG